MNMRLTISLVAVMMLSTACMKERTLLGEVIRPPTDGGAPSADAGGSCQWSHPQGIETGRVTVVAAQGARVFAGTFHGLFLSTDGAQSWAAVEGFPQDEVSSIAFSDDAIFAVAQDSQAAVHVYRSTDGLSWTRAEDGLNEASPVIRLFSSGGRLVASAGGSINTGFEWSPSAQAWRAFDAPFAVESWAANGTTELIVTGYGSSIQYREGQGPWTEAMSSTEEFIQDVWPFGTGFAVNTGSAIYLSPNGKTFATTTLPDGESRGPGTLLAGSNELVAAFSSGVYRSSNGVAWARLGETSFAGPSTGSLATDGHVIFAATFDGVRSIAPGDAEWAERNVGMIGATVRAFSVQGSSVYAVTTLDRIWSSDDFGQTWSEGPQLKEGADTVSVGVAAGAVFVGTTNDGIFRSTDEGASFEAVNTGVPTFQLSTGPVFHTPMGISAVGDVVVIGLSMGAIRSTNGGDSWEPANNGLNILGYNEANQPLYTSIYRVFALGDVLLAASAEGGLYRSLDAAASWVKVDQGIPLQAGPRPADVRGVAKLGNEVFAGGLRSDKGYFGVLLRSTDDGATWTDLSSQLPPGVIVHDLKSDGTRMYALLMHPLPSPEDGVFASQDGKSWTRVAGEPGARRLNSIAFPGDRLLLGTDGRGVLSTSITQCGL